MIYLAELGVPRSEFLGGGVWTLSDLKDITVLIGKNGSGKSILMRAIRDQDPNQRHYIVPERTGEIDFQAHLMLDESDGGMRRAQTMRNFNPEYRRRIANRVQAYFLQRGGVRQGVPGGAPQDIEAMLSILAPDFTVELLNLPAVPYQVSRLGVPGAIGNVDVLSTGEAQLLTLGLDALTMAAIWEVQHAPQRLLLVDEPDAHLHPDLQARFADFLVQIVHKYSLQVIVSTHSMSLLAGLTQFGGTKTASVYLSQSKNAYTAETTSEVTKELAACLGGHVLMGPLFGSPLLLVEGDDDYRIWGQVPRHHVVSMAVIPCEGSDQVKRYQAKLEQIFGALAEPPPVPVGYALLDGDMNLPQPQPGNPQQHVRYVKLDCHEAENLYLTDQVLATIGHDFISAVSAIRKAAESRPDKADALHAAYMDRRWSDLKNLMSVLAEALDPKSLSWTIRVSGAIGKSRPSGSLEEFLGAGMMNAFWPE